MKTTHLRRGLDKVYSTLALHTAHKDSCCGTQPRPPSNTSPTASASVSDFDHDFVCVDTDNEPREANEDANSAHNMGKSNKFDYSNRNSGGGKLGAIIGRDIEEKAKKAGKEVEKQVTKTRKASISSNVSAASVEAGPVVSHVLDIKAPSKELGDEGVCAIAEGLVNALGMATAEASCRLEDLNLSDNGITAAALARLSPAIELAKYDVKTLNLSNNAIKVETEQESADWETFLRSFKHCMKLRRLDLSGNPLGSRALEILARVHIQESAISPKTEDLAASVYSLTAETEVMDTPTATEFTDKMCEATLLKRRCGLRSIPFITLTNIGLNDAGALWLSYVLEDHYYPGQLIDEVNAVQPDSSIKTYQQQSNFNGLDWDEREPTLGRDGLYLLKKIETVRRQTLLDNDSLYSNADSPTGFGFDGMDTSSRSPAKRPTENRQPRARPGDRRGSVRSIQSCDGGEHELSEIESLRKRLQRHTIAQSGASSVELFRAGIKMAVSSTLLRGLIAHPGATSRYYIGPPIFHFTQPVSQPSTPVTDTKPGELRISTESAKGSSTHLPRQGTYAATLTANVGLSAGEPELAITEVTNSPQTPKMIFKPHRKGAFSDGSDLQAVTQKLDGLIIRDDSPLRFIRWQESRGADEDSPDGFRNSAAPNHLPERLVKQIAEEMITGKEREMLSEKQRQTACDWGQNRANFQVAESWGKMAESAQVWTLLESIGCLAYQKDE